jgi:hypothetical protein
MFKKFLEYIAEGGNVKIGSVAAAPFPITEKNRSSVRNDAHEALSALHDSFHKATGNHIFGKNKKALKTSSAFAGSTRQLMGSEVSDKDFAKHKRDVGDFDVFVNKNHKDALHDHIKEGMKLGNYTVAAKNKSSVLLKHKNGQVHQFDMVGADYEKDEPSKGEQFSHSSNWSDTEKGIKGAHHKILINATGLDTHKFSISHGVRSRTDDSDPGNKDPVHVTKKLFGNKADHNEIHSFTGVANLIKKHIPAEKHQEIYNKFKSSLKNLKFNHDAALSHLRNTLNVKDDMNEAAKVEEQTHHVSVIPLVGFSPFSHMGHAKDLGAKIKSMPGKKVIGISNKSDAFTPEERKNILSRQWGDDSIKYHVTSSGGDTIGKAYRSLPKTGKKVLNILVGADRKDFAHGLKRSLENGKIPEMEGNKFDEIHVHTPEDAERSHGMSGTKMRMAALSGNIDEFHRHLGDAFSKDEAKKLMSKTKNAITSGKLKVKR